MVVLMLIKCIHAGQHPVSTACGLVGSCWCACMHVLKTAPRQHSLQDCVMVMKCVHAWSQHTVSTCCAHSLQDWWAWAGVQDCMEISTQSAQRPGLVGLCWCACMHGRPRGQQQLVGNAASCADIY